MRFNLLILIIISCILVGMNGCHSSKKDPQIKEASVNQPKKTSHITTLSLQFNADPDMNLNPDHEPASVMIRVYQLLDNRAFLQARYNDLLKENNTSIQKDILVSYDLLINPNEKILLHRPIDPDTIYIGISAFFMKPNLQQDNWKIIIPRTELLRKDIPRIIEEKNNSLFLQPLPQ